MQLVIRPIERGTYLQVAVDAISCTYNMDGFTPMNAVLSTYRLDREHFRQCGRFHALPKFRAIGHGDGDQRPLIITTTKTVRWDDAPEATTEILTVADCERCESLRMTHFGFVLGRFPELAFKQCLLSIQKASALENLRHVILDVDEQHYDVALGVYRYFITDSQPKTVGIGEAGK